MHAPQKRPTRPAPRRAPLAATGSVGLSAALVREQLHRPFTAQELAHEQAQAAQHRRYQQITRSAKSFTQQQSVARQDGPIAYYAQARMRAELKYQAQTNHRLSVEKAAQQQYAANQTYIRQGPNRTMREEAEHQKQLAMKRSYDKYVESVRATNSPEIANTVLHDVVLRSVAESGLVVMGPNLSVARLAGTARWLGAARTAVALESMGARLTYQAGQMTWAGAGDAGKTFLARAAVDTGIQYGGAAIINGSKQYEKSGTINFGQLMLESTGGVNATSVFMAGLPGDRFIHSVRNALVANAFEINRDPDPTKGWGYKHVELNWRSGFNYGQKVGLSITTDYLAGRFSGGLQGVRTRDGYTSVGPLFDVHSLALWRQRLWLLHRAEFIGVYGLKITGGVSSSTLESHIIPPTPDVQPVK